MTSRTLFDLVSFQLGWIAGLYEADAFEVGDGTGTMTLYDEIKQCMYISSIAKRKVGIAMDLPSS